MKRLLAAACLALAASSAAHAADKIKLGFVTTLSGTTGSVGAEAQRGLQLALEHLGGRIGGLPVEVVTADDKGNTAEAVEIATRFIDRERVDIVVGLANSGVLMAAAKPFLDAGLFVIAAYSGPSPYAGKGCHRNAFFVHFQNDQWDEGLAHHLNEKGIKKLYVMNLDYQAGWDHVAGLKRVYTGQVVGEAATAFTQLDFSAEFAQLRAATPEAVFAFYVGGPAVAFVKQFSQLGLRGRIPLYTLDVLTDPLTLPALGNDAVGIVSATTWSPDLDNPANKRFVADFKAKHGRVPATYAQGHYDAIMLLDSAVRAVGGRIEDKDAFRAALKKADFQSVRGPFRFNNNHFPIHNVYLQEIVRDEGGLRAKLIGVAKENAADSYHRECALQ